MIVRLSKGLRKYYITNEKVISPTDRTRFRLSITIKPSKKTIRMKFMVAVQCEFILSHIHVSMTDHTKEFLPIYYWFCPISLPGWVHFHTVVPAFHTPFLTALNQSKHPASTVTLLTRRLNLFLYLRNYYPFWFISA